MSKEYESPYTTSISDRSLALELQRSSYGHDYILEKLAEQSKVAFVPGSQAAGGMPPAMDPSQQMPPPPMDPAAAGGMPPMDPAMMGGAPPMDPAMMGGAPPMDPAAMGMMPPGAGPEMAGPGGMPAGASPEMSPPLTMETVTQLIDERMANAGNAGAAGKGEGSGKPAKPDPVSMMMQQNQELMSLVKQMIMQMQGGSPGSGEAAEDPNQMPQLSAASGNEETKLAAEGYHGGWVGLEGAMAREQLSPEGSSLQKSSTNLQFIMDALR